VERRHPNYPGELSSKPVAAERLRHPDELSTRARAMVVLQRAGIPFLVGGAYAFCAYTGIYRDTKDLDLFPKKKDALQALEILAADGWRTERANETWIYKAFRGPYYVDLIFNSGNGVAPVDDAWFARGRPAEVFGQNVDLIAPEELIWSKAFVLERERYDGSDLLHLFRSTGPSLDWDRMMKLFDRYWEVLLAHLMMFRFAYPGERSSVPKWVMAELLARTLDSVREGDWPSRICRGNLLSSVNFALDLKEWQYADGRAWDERER
jgi:hypothetical protein